MSTHHAVEVDLGHVLLDLEAPDAERPHGHLLHLLRRADVLAVPAELLDLLHPPADGAVPAQQDPDVLGPVEVPPVGLVGPRVRDAE